MQRETYEQIKQDVKQTWESLRIDILPYTFSQEEMEACIARLKNGKYSAYGVPADVYKALPEM
eukprot:12919428-Prorocentrum_lima.AAC.1